MDDKRASILEDLSADASRRRNEFLDDAGRKFVRFLDANKSRLKDLGGLVLIDDEPDYLFVTETGTFRSRSRYQDESGEWISDTEDIENGEDLVEIFNPADLYAAFVDAATAETAEPEEESAEDDADESIDEAGAEAGTEEASAEADVADEGEGEEASLYEWLDPAPLAPTDQRDAARLMYDLALTFQEGSQFEQARLIDDFQAAAAPAAEMLGDSKFVDDDDERLWLRSSGAIDGEVVSERDDDAKGEPDWQPLASSDDMVQFYDPTDLFGDLAEAIADSYPAVAPDGEDEGDDSEGGAADGDDTSDDT
jgi:hypothetical protein